MSFDDCVRKKAAAGKIDKDAAAEALKDYNSRYERNRQYAGDDSARAKAASDTAKKAQEQADYKKQRTIRHALHQQRLADELKAATGKGKKASTFFMDKSDGILLRKENILREAWHGMEGVADRFRAKYGGIARDTLGIKPVIRELLGEKTGDAMAAEAAGILRKGMDYVHTRFKAAGGDIGKLDNYYPQTHEASRIKEAGFDRWWQAIQRHTVNGGDIDKDTAQALYRSITEPEIVDAEMRMGQWRPNRLFGEETSPWNTKNRFFRFASADDFFAYNQEFGVGDNGLWDLATGYIDRMAHKSALYETFGPKPNDTARYLSDAVTAGGEGARRKRWADGTYLVGSGAIDQGSEPNAWMGAVSSVRNYLRAVQLGAAPLSAVSDTVFLAQSVRMAGLSPMRAMGRYLGQMNPLSGADRQLAKRSGFIADIANGKAMADARFAGEINGAGKEFSAWMSQFTYTASGLRAMTSATKNAAAMEMEATLAEQAGKAWSRLDSRFRRALQEHGLSETDWKKLAAVEAWEPEEGMRFLNAHAIRQHAMTKGAGDGELYRIADAVGDMVETLRAVAANEPLARTRAFTTGAGLAGEAARKGEVIREIMASVTMYKSFGVTVILNHLLPYFTKNSGKKWTDAAPMWLGLSVMGGMALQLKDLSKGREPRDMNTPQFWMAASLQSGGLGLYGDFLFADYSRFGRSPITELLGPLAGTADDVMRLTKGNFDRALEDPTGASVDRVKKDLFKFVKRYAPGNFWYNRLALERLLYDQIEEAANPDYARDRRRIARQLEKEFGQGYWWKPGG